MAHTNFLLTYPGEALSDQRVQSILKSLAPIAASFDMRLTFDKLEPSFTVTVRQDTDCMSPRENDNIGKMHFRHKRYTLGDDDCPDPGEVKNVAICIAVYMLDHSGITISTTPFNDPWDSGLLGWIYITQNDVRKHWPAAAGALENARACLEAEVKEYDLYLRGECWGYSVENEEGEITDSCWGYIGETLDDTGMLHHVNDEYKAALVVAWDKRYDT